MWKRTIVPILMAVASIPAAAQNNDGWASGTLVGDAYGVNTPDQTRKNKSLQTKRIGASANRRDVKRLGASVTAAKPKSTDEGAGPKRPSLSSLAP